MQAGKMAVGLTLLLYPTVKKSDRARSSLARSLVCRLCGLFKDGASQLAQLSLPGLTQNTIFNRMYRISRMFFYVFILKILSILFTLRKSWSHQNSSLTLVSIRKLNDVIASRLPLAAKQSPKGQSFPLNGRLLRGCRPSQWHLPQEKIIFG